MDANPEKSAILSTASLTMDQPFLLMSFFCAQLFACACQIADASSQPPKVGQTIGGREKGEKKAGTEWTHFPLWPSRDLFTSIGYQQCLADMCRQMLQLLIHSKSAAHLYRKVGARRIDDQGADEAVRLSSPRE